MKDQDLPPELERIFVDFDRSQILRTSNLKYIPEFANRTGGKRAYAEWAQVIGIFQALIADQIEGVLNPTIVDIGCGTGILAIAAYPFLINNGQYVGIDVVSDNIDFCRSYYQFKNFSFLYHQVFHSHYAPEVSDEPRYWDLDPSSTDLALALSVWTHLNELEAGFYLSNLVEVLKPGGRAILSFFLLDNLYYQTLQRRNSELSNYYNTTSNKWVFDQAVDNQADFLCPVWARSAGEVVAIKYEKLIKLLKDRKLEVLKYYPGNWKEQPGLFFQDIIIVRKCSEIGSI